jgi:hypothetical protein
MAAIPDRHGCHFGTSEGERQPRGSRRLMLIGQKAGAPPPREGRDRRCGDIVMGATGQLRHRSVANQRRATFSAWAMSIVFAAIAAISFAVDQTMVSSLGAGDDLGRSLGSLSPVRLIQSLIDTASGRSDRAE